MDKQEYAARVEWMKRYRKSKNKENILMLRLSEAKDCASNIHSTSSGVRCQTANGMSGIQRAVERIERAEGALLDQREVCNTLYRETLGVILKVPDTKQRRVLRLRYLAGWTMYKIADQLHITERHARRLHREAIYRIEMSG